MKTLSLYGQARIIVAIALFIAIGTTHGQKVEVPGSHSKEVGKEKTISVDVIPQLSYSDHPAVWNQAWGPHCKASKPCARKARRFIKKEQFIEGLGYAARALEMKPKKRAERRALDVLTSGNYARAQKEFEKNLNDYPNVPKYINWKSSKAMYYRMWYANRMNHVNAMLQKLDHPKVKITVNPVDHHMLGKLAGTLSTYRKYSANDYYAGGNYYQQQGAKSNDKEDYKRAAMAYKISEYYVTDFKDAKQQYESAKKKATSTVYFSAHYHGHGGFGGTLDEDVKAQLIQNTGFNRLPFVEMVNTKSADYHVKMVTNGLELITRGKTSDKQEYSKEVMDENGKTITKKATIITYTSGYNTRAKVNVEVIDLRSKKVVYSTVSEHTYEWVTVWQKGSGSTDIVKGKYKKYLDNQPDRAPTRKTFYERAIAMCARDIATKLYVNFFLRIGAEPKY
ncbi:hypothetical protein [Aquimarina algiphila]|uniref:Uncharacterized protein n=1 Tax=Aquimarina algiphila TaxID=2047982 RepID=A0A554VCF6_9FLAO|nr:hypothetical protein [Aquimarina algiphila]TSE04387.1 hypothetical protein FOF46_26540 [Aquimarina algiphila]